MARVKNSFAATNIFAYCRSDISPHSRSLHALCFVVNPITELSSSTKLLGSLKSTENCSHFLIHVARIESLTNLASIF